VRSVIDRPRPAPVNATVAPSCCAVRATAKATTKEKRVVDDKSKAAQAVSVLKDLQLHKIALEAFHKGNDAISLTLTRKGEGLELAGQFDEGTLLAHNCRFSSSKRTEQTCRSLSA
jgi:hypothetical protein